MRRPPALPGGQIPTSGDGTPPRPPWAGLLVVNGVEVFGPGPATVPPAVVSPVGVSPTPPAPGDPGPGPDELDTATDGSWVMVPVWLYRHPGLTGTDCAVWAAVKFYAGRSGVCFAGRARLGEWAGVTVHTVRRSITELTAAGAVTVQHRHRQSSLIWPRMRPLRPVISTPAELGQIIDTAAGLEPLPDPGPEPTAAELDARAAGMSWADIARALAAGDL